MLLLSTTAFAENEIIVAQDGSGNFKSIQEAINSLPAEGKGQRVIVIKKGTYREKLFVEKNFITLRGENRDETTIIISEAREIFRCNNKNDDWGVATINLKGSDINLENLSFINEYGFITKDTVSVFCAADTVPKTKTVKRTGHQMALRSFTTTRLKVINCVFRAGGGDTVSPWNTDDGMFYFKDCIMEGHVDMYCPRGWALADHCEFICHSKEAAIWHDGSKHQESKTVFFNCRFTGDEGFKLGRWHRDAQFYLFDCSFSKEMADANIYQRVATPPNVIQWGQRVYYYNCHRDGGDYEWHKNNLPSSISINDINAAWAFDYKWKPADVKNVPGDDAVETKSKYDTVAENMLLYQRKNGGWPKHFNKTKVDYHHTLTAEELNELKSGYEASVDATIDNSATTKEIRYLAKAYKRSNDKRFLKAAEKGIEYLLDAQYPNGGWPQYYPDFTSYRSEITYNDNAMVNALNVLLDVLEKDNDLDVINSSYYKACASAVKRGISCILKTQVRQNKKLTVWCAQYDAKTLKPAKARSYELPSLSGGESVGILRFLMRVSADKKIIAAVKGGIEWFKKSKIEGYKFEEIKTAEGRDRVLTAEPGSVIWARFYDLKTNEPFFSGRDGQRKKTLAEIEKERRVGYAWYVDAPKKLIEEDYPKWEAKYK